MLTTKILVCALLEMGVPNHLANKITPVILKESKKRSISPSLVPAIIWNESRFKPKVVSKSLDYGLMQIHCPRKDYMWWCREPKRLLEYRFNIKVGTRVLQLKKKKCRKKKDWLSCYNPYSKGYAKRVRTIQNRVKRLIKNCKNSKL